MANRERRKAADRRGRTRKEAARKAATRSEPTATETDGPADAQDPRAVEALTVGWMLSLLACLFSELGAVIGFVVVAVAGGAEQMPGLWGLAPLVMAFIAWITGTCCLVLTVIANRVRRTAAPRVVVRAAWVSGLLPWLALAGLLFTKAAGG